MKSILCYATLLVILMFVGCTTDTTTPSLPISPGNYIGKFSITYNYGAVNKYTVEGATSFTFTDTSYSCFGEVRYHPPSGCGSYVCLSNEVVILTDLCIHTAEFDWTLILNGPFQYNFDGKTLTMTQNDSQYLRYRKIVLTKQN